MNIYKSISKLFIFLFISTLFFSCSDKEDEQIEPTISTDEIARINDIVVADLAANYKTKNSDINEEPKQTVMVSSEVQKIDNQYYLVSTSENSRTSSLLKVNASGKMLYAGISCTSSICTQTMNCVPETQTKCTECPGDCTRTVSL